MLKAFFKWMKKMFGLDDGGKMDNSLVESAVAIAQASSGALALIKKIPLFRDYLLYEEGNVMLHKAVNEKLVNEYKILNDPKAQAEFINSFPTEMERNLVAGHILDVQANAQKSLNVVEVLKRFNENIKTADAKDIDDNQMEPDWWLLWLERAQMTSNPQKQEILAKALEMENKKQGTVSARFIRVLGDMSINELDLFRDLSKFFSTDGYLYTHLGQVISDETFCDIGFDEQKKLEGLSLARFASGMGEYYCMHQLSNGSENYFALKFMNYCVLIWKEQEQLDIAYEMSLTAEGVLLQKLMSISADFDHLMSLSMKISKEMQCRVSIHKYAANKGALREAVRSYTNGTEDVV